jgi:hypothetical protein
MVQSSPGTHTHGPKDLWASAYRTPTSPASLYQAPCSVDLSLSGLTYGQRDPDLNARPLFLALIMIGRSVD